MDIEGESEDDIPGAAGVSSPHAFESSNQMEGSWLG